MTAAGLGHTDVVAVYTILTPTFVQAMVSVYPELNGPPPGHGVVELEGIAQGSINTTYRVRLSDDSVWFLRVNEGKPFERLVRERDLLHKLGALHAQLCVVTPKMAVSVAGSAFFAVDIPSGDRRWACIFPRLPGRELGVFEVDASHAVQIGAFLGRMHRLLRRFPCGPNPYGHRVVQGWLPALVAHPTTSTTALLLQRRLQSVLRRRRPLPRGLIHGDLFVDNTRWDVAGKTLRAVFDWEMAGRDHLALDLAITICAWCFRRDGEAMVLREDVAAALVDGYQHERRLEPSERRGLHGELLLASLRFAASRLRDFGLPREATVERRFLDPADYVGRFDHVAGLGERRLRGMLGVSGAGRGT